MGKKYIVLKVPSGSPAPVGYSFVRNLPRQSLDIYQKELPHQVVTRADIDDLSSLFGAMALPQDAVAVADELEVDALIRQIGAMGVQGGRRRGRRSTKKHLKKRRRTRRN